MIRIIKIDKLIDELSMELAYLQNRADYWYYINNDIEMSSFILDYVTEVREICNRFGVLQEVYDDALSIYDFSRSGEKGFEPDIEYIQDMQNYFEDRHHHRLLF